MAPTALTDLPPELLLHVTDYLKEASSIARLGRTSKNLRTFVDQEAWKSFSKTQFPTICPQDSPSFRDTARTLTTLSQALDKRALVAKCVEPTGDITAFPGRRKIDRWKRPRGQTIGFTPHIDVYEAIGSKWQEREETLAFSAGAEVCIRQTTRKAGAEPTSRWTTYKPFSAYEGRDDITSLHLLRPDGSSKDNHSILTGTANGDLQLTRTPKPGSWGEDVRVTYFTTQGMSVRSSSLLQEQSQPTLLAASLGECSLALYQVDGESAKIAPSSQVDLKPVLRPDGHPLSQRIWSTKFLSPSALAVGVGPSAEPIQILSVGQSSITRDPLRKFGLKNDVTKLDGIVKSGTFKPPVSSVYTIEPFPAASGAGSVFLSGAYDGIVRLHDLRSDNEVETRFLDPSDDSPIYSVLPQGQERITVGTGRHNLLKVFDLRMGAKCYNSRCSSNNSNVYLRTKGGGQASNWSRNRPIESSVYSLASSSPASPFIYAGLENVIMSLASTEILDHHPDLAFFRPTLTRAGKARTNGHNLLNDKDVLDLAMHDQGYMNLYQQLSPRETLRARDAGRTTTGRLCARWKSSAEASTES